MLLLRHVSGSSGGSVRCTLLCICSMPGGPQRLSAQQPAQASKGHTSPPVVADAQAAAARLWASVIVKCGGKTDAQPLQFATYTGPSESANGLLEVDSPSFKVVAAEVTRAEALNGVQWKGVAILDSPAVRTPGDQFHEPYTEDSSYSNYQRTVRSIGMVKINGLWRYMTLYGGDLRYEDTVWDHRRSGVEEAV